MKGKILEADFAQLEFRVAAFCHKTKLLWKKCPQVLMFTPTQLRLSLRQDNLRLGKKLRHIPLRPLYGATGFGRTKAEAEYYTHFMDKYKGIAKWHKKLGDEAINLAE